MIKQILRAGFWLIVFGALSTFVYWLWTHPDYLTWTFWQTGKDGVIQSSRSEVVRNLGLLAIGIIGLLFAVWRAWLANRHQRSIELGQITDSFTKAVEQLGSTELAIQQGAIHALWRIAEDSPKRDYARVLDVLCSYVRNKEHLVITEDTTPPAPPDVQTIIDRLKERSNTLKQLESFSRIRFSMTRESAPNETPVPGTFGFVQKEKVRTLQINFSGAYLCWADLSKIDLHGANLRNAILNHANLSNSDLSDAALIDVEASQAIFSDANCRKTFFQNANLESADFFWAVLDSAELTDCNCEKIGFSHISALRTVFSNSNLSKAILRRSNFKEAELISCDLSEARFLNTTLEDTQISGSNFTGCKNFDLTSQQLRQSWAFITDPPKGLTEQGLPMPRFVTFKHWDFEIAEGYPKNAPPEGMSEEEIAAYFAKQEANNKKRR